MVWFAKFVGPCSVLLPHTRRFLITFGKVTKFKKNRRRSSECET